MRKVENKLDQKGVAIIETAVMLPFLILSSLVVYDIGRLFYLYLTVSEIAREAALNGSRIPKLQTSIFPEQFFDHKLNQPTVTSMGGHEIIRSRIKLTRYLLANELPVPANNITSRSQKIRSSELDMDLNADGVVDKEGFAVRVIVDAKYHSIFYPGTPIFNVKAEQVISYLGSN